MRRAQIQEIRKNPYTKDVSNVLLKIGTILKEAREKKSLTQKDIHQVTCIPLSHIYAIESGDRKSLPEDIFLLGFIKRYAKVVNLDEQTLCSVYVQEKKISSWQSHEDEFDLLFQQEKNLKVIPFQDRHKERKYFRVFQLYLLIGFILVTAFAYMCLMSIFRSQDKSSHQHYLVLENGNSTFEDNFKFNYNEIESWVGETDKPDVLSKTRHVIARKGFSPDEAISLRKVEKDDTLKIEKNKPQIKKNSIVQNTKKITLMKNSEIKLRPLRVNREENKTQDVPLRRIRVEE